MIHSEIYPSLGRYFRSVTELADAACCGRTRATDCLHGRKEFTAQEKQALLNAITLKQQGIEVRIDFDQYFKRGI